MRRVQTTCALTIALMGLLSSGYYSLAVPVSMPVIPNQQVNAPISGTSLAQRPELAGVVIEEFSRPLSSDPLFAQGLVATMHQQVLRTGGGTLDFYSWVSVDPSSAVTVTDLKVNAFPAVSLDVDFRKDLPGDAQPHAVLLEGGNVNSVLFDFHLDPIAPGETSKPALIRTQVTVFSREGSFRTFGLVDVELEQGVSIGQSDALAAAPAAAPIPLPPAWGAGGICLIIVVAVVGGSQIWQRRAETSWSG